MGGGYIAAEQCCIYNGFGADVHLFFRGEHMLNGFDMENRLHLEEEFKKQGISLWPTYSPTKASWVCFSHSLEQLVCPWTILLAPGLGMTFTGTKSSLRLSPQGPAKGPVLPRLQPEQRKGAILGAAQAWLFGVCRVNSAWQLPA